jgi:predicted transcriptional regulator
MRPTAGELEILRVLWRIGPATVRGVHDALERRQGYTTVLKLMQIMTDKGLVRRSEEQRAHVYHPAVSQVEVQTSLVGDLLERAFGGSAAQLALRALASQPASAEEIAEIRRMLSEYESARPLAATPGSGQDVVGLEVKDREAKDKESGK